jgi:WD40 repeat protein
MCAACCQQVVLYHALSGRVLWVMGSHAGMVHSMSWARDDSSLVTASADFTAKLWRLPELPGPPVAHVTQPGIDSSGGLGATGASCWPSSTQPGGSSAWAPAAGGTWAATAAAGAGAAGGGGMCASQEGMLASFKPSALASTSGAAATTLAAAAAGVSVTVLQHTCYVYAAEQHPLPQSAGVTVATAAFDGAVRLWSEQGVALCSLQVRRHRQSVGNGCCVSHGCFTRPRTQHGTCCLRPRCAACPSTAWRLISWARACLWVTHLGS